ncbi:MAG: hypothetical protein ABMA01_05780 [Chthoniobacteraceae bacterium]
MQLNDPQKQRVAAWIAEGVKLSDIQDRLAAEFDLRLTYMDVRLIVDDLKLTPKDAEVPAAPAPAADAAPEMAPSPLSEPGPAPAGKVALSVDQIARPGAMVSGSVTFTDGKTAQWHIDQQGRLGVVPTDPGYRPPPADVEEFQIALDRELQKLGF